MGRNYSLYRGTIQVNDNFSVLKTMLDDTEAAPGIYKPTIYWKTYEKFSLPELLHLGLHDFRRRKETILSKFGATDYNPEIPIDFKKSKIIEKLHNAQIRLIDKAVRHRMKTSVDKESKRIGAKSFREFEASVVGNPEHVIEIDGKLYTYKILHYYRQYLYCCRYINFDSVKTMVELGSGAGKQAEVIKKLYPDICILLFDIPPQLYVCQQYLSAVFPDCVVPYESTREMTKLPEDRRGKIFLFGSHKFPILDSIESDLFWSACSFQEMEPEVVANYLSYVNRSAKTVYLAQMMEGKHLISKTRSRGVFKPTVFEDYKRGLSNFNLLDCSPTPMASSDKESSSFWVRKLKVDTEVTKEEKVDLQNSSNALLNWFLHPSDLEGHTLYMIAMNIKAAYHNLHMFEGEEIEKDIPSIDWSKYKDQDYIEPLKRLQQTEKLNHYISHFILHGSLATRDYIKGWSDVDALLVIKKETLDDPGKLLELRELCLAMHPILGEIDPLHHHGLQFITEYDLEAYPDTFLPPVIFDYSVSLLGQSKMNLRVRDCGEEWFVVFHKICETLKQACEQGELRHHPYKGEFLLSHFRNDAMYQLKYLLSLVMLLPSYYLGLKGKSVYKKYSFDACPKFKNWGIVEKASNIRSLWVETEGNKISGWVKEILGEDYLCEASKLAEEMNDRL